MASWNMSTALSERISEMKFMGSTIYSTTEQGVCLSRSFMLCFHILCVFLDFDVFIYEDIGDLDIVDEPDSKIEDIICPAWDQICLCCCCPYIFR